MSDTIYASGKILTKATVAGVELKLSTQAQGMLGVIPIFESEADAKRFDPEAPIIELKTMDMT